MGQICLAERQPVVLIGLALCCAQIVEFQTEYPGWEENKRRELVGDDGSSDEEEGESVAEAYVTECIGESCHDLSRFSLGQVAL